MSDWSKVNNACERMDVPGGWLYRTWDHNGVAICFVPMPPPEPPAASGQIHAHDGLAVRCAGKMEHTPFGARCSGYVDPAAEVVLPNPMATLAAIQAEAAPAEEPEWKAPTVSLPGGDGGTSPRVEGQRKPGPTLFRPAPETPQPARITDHPFEGAPVTVKSGNRDTCLRCGQPRDRHER